MIEVEVLYEFIWDKFCKNDGVVRGKMMFFFVVKFKGKVFIFFYNERMIFKLGKDFEFEEEGL